MVGGCGGGWYWLWVVVVVRAPASAALPLSTVKGASYIPSHLELGHCHPLLFTLDMFTNIPFKLNYRYGNFILKTFTGVMTQSTICLDDQAYMVDYGLNYSTRRHTTFRFLCQVSCQHLSKQPSLYDWYKYGMS